MTTYCIYGSNKNTLSVVKIDKYINNKYNETMGCTVCFLWSF